MSESKFREYLAPTIVLLCICLVVSGALAYVNSITAPIIDAKALQLANATRSELLPEAGGFTEYDGKLLVEEFGKVYVTDAYLADGGGAVITVATKSFGGILTEMVGIDADGAITGVKILSHSDTKGLGTRAHEPSHLAQYVGLTALQSKDIKDDSSVDAVSGASVSSGGIHKGVYCALMQYEEMRRDM